MGKNRIIKAHTHGLINQRVDAAINKAADDIVLMFTEHGCTDQDGLREEVLDIIMKHAYYGDALANGTITEADLASIREFAAA